MEGIARITTRKEFDSLDVTLLFASTQSRVLVQWRSFLYPVADISDSGLGKQIVFLELKWRGVDLI